MNDSELLTKFRDSIIENNNTFNKELLLKNELLNLTDDKLKVIQLLDELIVDNNLLTNDDVVINEDRTWTCTFKNDNWIQIINNKILATQKYETPVIETPVIEETKQIKQLKEEINKLANKELIGNLKSGLAKLSQTEQKLKEVTLEGPNTFTVSFLENYNKKLEERASPIYNRTFVFTGKLDNYSRQEAEGIIKTWGGWVGKDVSINTNYLVVGSDPGSKLNRAKNLNISIINEEEFVQLISP
jgi:NAD-dependent DNA ligase